MTQKRPRFNEMSIMKIINNSKIIIDNTTNFLPSVTKTKEKKQDQIIREKRFKDSFKTKWKEIKQNPSNWKANKHLIPKKIWMIWMEWSMFIVGWVVYSVNLWNLVDYRYYRWHGKDIGNRERCGRQHTWIRPAHKWQSNVDDRWWHCNQTICIAREYSVARAASVEPIDLYDSDLDQITASKIRSPPFQSCSHMSLVSNSEEVPDALILPAHRSLQRCRITYQEKETVQDHPIEEETAQEVCAQVEWMISKRASLQMIAMPAMIPETLERRRRLGS